MNDLGPGVYDDGLTNSRTVGRAQENGRREERST